MEKNALRNIDNLIQRLNNTEPLSDNKREKLHKLHFQQVFEKMVDEGVNYRVASGTPEFYNQDGQSFREYIKNTDQDIDWQCESVRNGFSRYLQIGETPPPYFPMRIAILLRKAKEKEREKSFLTAWCRHFGTINPNHGKYFKLSERLRMLLSS